MRPLAQSPTTVFCHDNRIAPRADVLVIRGDSRGLADKNHILAQRDSQPLWAMRIGGKDRTAIPRAAAMPVVIRFGPGVGPRFGVDAAFAPARDCSQPADANSRLQIF